MDGPFYLDMRTPFLTTAVPAVTLAATDKALYPVGQFPTLGANYFAFPGKKIKIRMFGQMTTAATPGNGTFDIYYGTGADANGVIIGSSIAQTLVATQTNQSWQLEIVVSCMTIGATGTLLCTGTYDYTPAVVATGGGLLPASAPAASGACDLTLANIISVQYKRSGSTAETMQVVHMEVWALN